MFRWLKVWSLTRQLRSPSSTAARAAAEELGRLGDPRAVEPLVAALGDGDADLRYAAAEELGRLGDPRAVEPLIAALGDGEHYVRRAAAEALVQLGALHSVGPLIAALGDENEYVRRVAAAKALGQLGDPRGVEPLIAALEDPDMSVQCAAARALGQLRDPRAVDPLLAALTTRDKETSRAVADSLAELENPGAVKALLGAGDWGDTRAKADAVLTLRGDLGGIYGLVRALESKGGEAVAKALGTVGDCRAVPPLLMALARCSSSGRVRAAEVLAQLGEPQWGALVHGDEGDYRRLATCGDDRVMQNLVAILGRFDGAWSVATVLAELGDARAVEWLVARLDDMNADRRRAAARGLTELAARNPTALLPHWRKVRRKVVLRHSDDLYDSHEDQPGNCGWHDDHTWSSHADRGIGLDFPNPPAEATQGEPLDF